MRKERKTLISHHIIAASIVPPCPCPLPAVSCLCAVCCLLCRAEQQSMGLFVMLCVCFLLDPPHTLIYRRDMMKMSHDQVRSAQVYGFVFLEPEQLEDGIQLK